VHGRSTRLALFCGVTRQTIHAYRTDTTRVPSAELAEAIEACTDGAVPAVDWAAQSLESAKLGRLISTLIALGCVTIEGRPELFLLSLLLDDLEGARYQDWTIRNGEIERIV
jgi:hypothetical protein